MGAEAPSTPYMDPPLYAQWTREKNQELQNNNCTSMTFEGESQTLPIQGHETTMMEL